MLAFDNGTKPNESHHQEADVLQIDANSIHAAKHAQSDHPVHGLIATRWSPRAYASTPVPAEHLRSVFEAARWAASSGNGQPWSFIVATNDQPETYSRLADCLSEGNVPWATRAPVLGLVVAQTVRSNGRTNRTAFYDAGLAVQNLTIQATALGLSLRQMGGFSPEQARANFAIPEDYEPVAMFALGYVGDPAGLSDSHREQEMSVRLRRPLPEFVFGARWGETSTLVLYTNGDGGAERDVA